MLTDSPQIGLASDASSRGLRGELRARGLGLLLVGTFERAAGLRQEDVVERGLVELEVGDLDTRGVERPDDVREIGLAGAEADADALDRYAGIAEAREDLRQPRRLIGIVRNRLDGRPADLGLELVGRPFGDDVTVVDDSDPVREHICLLEVLRGQEDGYRVLPREPGDLVPEGRPALNVEPGRRLIEEEHARPVDERHRQVEPALHPARIAAYLAVGGVCQPDPRDQLVRTLIALAAGQGL